MERVGRRQASTSGRRPRPWGWVPLTIDLLKRDSRCFGRSPAEMDEIQAFFIRLGMRFVLQVRS
jgi:hypothetical protein